MKTATRNTILSSIGIAFALTIVIWLTAGSLASRFDVVNEKYFSLKNKPLPMVVEPILVLPLYRI